MAAGSSPAVSSADRELIVTRLIDAPRRLVFRAWTEPEQVSRWWGPQLDAALRARVALLHALA